MKIEPIYDRSANYQVLEGGRMKRSKICVVTNEEYSVDVNAIDVQDWREGRLIQNAMPNLSLEQREFLISGLTPSEFKEMYKFDDDE